MILQRGSHMLVEAGRILRFGLVGIAATLVYIAAAMLGDEWLGFTAVAGAIVGQAASTAVSYFGHLYYSFRVKSDHRVFLWRFTLISLVVLVLNTGVSWTLTDVFDTSHRIAIAVLAILNSYHKLSLQPVLGLSTRIAANIACGRIYWALATWYG